VGANGKHHCGGLGDVLAYVKKYEHTENIC
jgi:hypothetical protein